MAKVITIFVLLYSMSLPTYAMKTYQLDCPDRGIMTVLHTNYLITTLKWGSEFFVSRPTIRYRKEDARYNIYDFLNGDSLIKTLGDNKRYYFIYKDGDRVECHKQSETQLVITQLPITQLPIVP